MARPGCTMGMLRPGPAARLPAACAGGHMPATCQGRMPACCQSKPRQGLHRVLRGHSNRSNRERRTSCTTMHGKQGAQLAAGVHALSGHWALHVIIRHHQQQSGHQSSMYACIWRRQRHVLAVLPGLIRACDTERLACVTPRLVQQLPGRCWACLFMCQLACVA